MPESLLLWVTRTAPYNMLTAHRLRAMGHHVLAEPLLVIRHMALGRPAGIPDALVFTSAHAVRHHPLDPAWLEIPVYTVGDRTAEAAQRAGYRLLRSADGDVDDLQRLMLDTLPISAQVLHYGARETAGDLCGVLVAAGYRASKWVVYEATPSPAPCMERIRAALDTVDGIVVHSPRAAFLASGIASEGEWTGTVFCLSQNCAKPFAGLMGVETIVAAMPREDSLMAAVRERLSNGLSGNGEAPGARQPVARSVWSGAVRVSMVGQPANDNGLNPPSRHHPDGDGPDDPSPTAA